MAQIGRSSKLVLPKWPLWCGNHLFVAWKANVHWDFKTEKSFENVSLAKNIRPRFISKELHQQKLCFQNFLRKKRKSSVRRVICARFLSVSERSVWEEWVKAVCSVDSSQWVMEEMMGGFFTLIYGRDDIVGSHANMPHKGLDLMVP